MSQKPDSRLAHEFLASPNHGARRGFANPNCVILHYTGMPSSHGALAWLRNPTSEVSCHYFIWEDGQIAQLVAESQRAWHAGKGVWKSESDLNSASIGIEIVNPGHEQLPPYPPRQIDAVIALCRDIGARHHIRRERILAHSDIAPARKRDPGEHFPWGALAEAGVGHWTPPAPISGPALYALGGRGAPVRALQAMLSLYGYGVEITGVFDHQTKIVVQAFQRHFRPSRVDGEADASTIATLTALLESLHASL